MSATLIARSQEALDVDLENANGIPQLELFQDSWMQDAESANDLFLSSNPDMYRCSVTREKSRIFG